MDIVKQGKRTASNMFGDFGFFVFLIFVCLFRPIPPPYPLTHTNVTHIPRFKSLYRLCNGSDGDYSGYYMIGMMIKFEDDNTGSIILLRLRIVSYIHELNSFETKSFFYHDIITYRSDWSIHGNQIFNFTVPGVY